MFRSLSKGGVHLAALYAAMALVAVPLPVSARPKNLDQTLDRSSDHGAFRVQLASAAAPIPLRQIHQWTVHIADPSGRPVSGASLMVDGGMPEHHHGLPTKPRATPGASAGDYVISGMKFSMSGWWVLKLNIQDPGGQTDTVTFNVVL